MRIPAFGKAALFFGLTIAFSWSYWLATLASTSGWIPYRIPLTPLGAFGPAVAAILTAALCGQRRELAGLLSRFWVRGITWRGLAAALLTWPALVGAALVVAGLAGAPLSGGGAVSFRLVLLIFGETLVFTAIAEELGWRGYALPILLRAYNPVIASVIVGAAWALWHLPLFWIPGTPQADIHFAYFALAVVAYSFIYTAVFLGSRPSILPVILLHTTADTALGVAQLRWPEATSGSSFWLAYFTIVLVAAAMVALLFQRNQRPTPTSPGAAA